MNRQSTGIKDIIYIAVFTAIIAVLAQISIPMPGGVPMTMQTFAVPLAGIVLGAKRGTISTLIYVLLGFIGVPVFAGFSGGAGIVLGVTGGFIVSFPLMAFLAGLGMRVADRQRMSERNRAMAWVMIYAGLIVGALINYLIGSLWFMAVAGGSFARAVTLCVVPFIPTAIIKIIAVGCLGPVLRNMLIKAHILEPQMQG